MRNSVSNLLIFGASVAIGLGVTYAIPEEYAPHALLGLVGTAFVLTRRCVNDRLMQFIDRAYEATLPPEQRPTSTNQRLDSSDLSDRL